MSSKIQFKFEKTTQEFGGKVGSQRIPADLNYFIDREYVLDDRHKTAFFLLSFPSVRISWLDTASVFFFFLQSIFRFSQRSK